jgi:hypothetical protein
MKSHERVTGRRGKFRSRKRYGREMKSHERARHNGKSRDRREVIGRGGILGEKSGVEWGESGGEVCFGEKDGEEFDEV